ncbi:glycosyltransferase family 2 protein [Caviibacter abscessus]|uniref:glycosyltransferase family 2 protein n=1 Tax=Caviibacter abscessus TaxID=1766719 RepID=UPI00082A67D2|nr:glycosyltransferase family 2 protein [Caviibacter abscessus]
MEKVSIITPVYNSEKYIRNTIESVLNQTYKNFELILINDKSSDKSLKICQSYDDERIKIIDLEKNVGVCRARNIGIEKACGRYISFLDSDDIWSENKLMEQIEFMKKNSAEICCTEYERVNENLEKIGYIHIKEKISYQDMLKNNYVGCLTVIYDTFSIGKMYFDEINKNEDYLLWLKIIKKTGYIYGLRKNLAKYRVITGSRSSNKFKVILARWEIYRKYEKLNILSSFYYIINYGIIAVVKNRRISK